MTTVTQLHRIIAERLAATGIGTYRATGVYTATETGITIKAVPQSPDRIVAVTIYDEIAALDPDDPTTVIPVQLRFRAGTYPTDVDDIADAAKAAMTVHHDVWSGVRIHRCHRRNFTPIGADANKRHERTDNYELVLG